MITAHLLTVSIYLPSVLRDTATLGQRTQAVVHTVLCGLILAAWLFARRLQQASVSAKSMFCFMTTVGYLLGASVASGSDVGAGNSPVTYMLVSFSSGLVVLLPTTQSVVAALIGVSAMVAAIGHFVPEMDRAMSVSADVLGFCVVGWGIGRIRYLQEMQSFLLTQQLSERQAELAEAFSQQRRALAQLERAKVELERLVEYDGLTGAASRRKLFSVGQNWQGALVLIDIDFFKNVNDIHGHDAGDLVLIELVRRLSAAAPSDSCVARLGGEEFVVLLPLTEISPVHAAAEALREVVAATPIATARGPLEVTVSIGWAPIEGQGVPALEAALLVADEGLYSAKRAGRNRIGPSPYLRQRRASASYKAEAT